MLDKDLRVMARWFLEREIVKVSEKPEDDFTLRHVGRDPIYFDLRLANETGKGITPHMGKALVERLASFIREPYADEYYIVGIPHGGDPLAEALGDRLNKPVVRLKKLLDGSIGGFISIAPPENALILLVENVTTSGESILTVNDFLLDQKKNYDNALAISVIDRGAGAIETLGKKGITLASIFQMEDLLGFYLAEKEILPEPCERSLAHAREIHARRKEMLGLGS